MSKENKIKLRVVFMGTSELSEIILKNLIENEYNIVGVFTKPDAKVGRKQQLRETAVKKLATENKLPVFQPEKFRSEAIVELKKLKPDLVIVAAYGKIIPKAALEIPAFGNINIHVSLLPKFRGPSPIQNALLLGEKETGVTIMLMDEGVDTGDILAQEKLQISDYDNTDTLMEKLADLGANLLIKTIPDWIEQKIEPQKQDHSKAILCQMIDREDGKILWEDSAEDIYNRYRALASWPGIFTYWQTDSGLVRIKLLEIELQKINPLSKYQTGEVFEIGADIGVQTNSGIIILKKLQREGKNPLDAKTFINGQTNFIGSILV